MNKTLIGLLIVIGLLALATGYLAAGNLNLQGQIDSIKTQTAQNTNNIQAIVDFINKSIAANTATQTTKK